MAAGLVGSLLRSAILLARPVPAGCGRCGARCIHRAPIAVRNTAPTLDRQAQVHPVTDQY